MNRKARIILGCLGIVVGLGGIVGIVLDKRAAKQQREMISREAARFRSGAMDSGVTWNGRTFREGDRVAITKWAGTFKPEETGAQVSVDARRGQTGIVLRGEKRVSTPHIRRDSAEPIQIVRVRWPAQKWKVNLRDQWIDLPEFEATIHVSYLEVVR